MKVLFVGDSITRGAQGVDWVKLIENDHPFWTLQNMGVNGETLNSISRRLLKHLENDNNYSTIVFQAGTNDILLPLFKHRSFWFQQAYQHQIKSGNLPLSPTNFESLLVRTVEYICENTNAQLILPTIGCINENMLAETNAQLFSYNSIIRKVAKEFNCILANTAGKFQEELSRRKTQDYCMENFQSTAFFDSISCSLGLADRLSKKRKLHLTIDGVHLNTKGASIYKTEIEKAILLSKEEILLYI